MNPEQSWTAQDSQRWIERMNRDRATQDRVARQRAIRHELLPPVADRGFTRVRPRTVMIGVVLGICGYACITGFWTWAGWLMDAVGRGS